MSKEEKQVVLPKTASDLQRLKLEKLMKKPDKEVVIGEKSQEYNPRAPLEFIRNVWGSSAGAGSGDFHVYRGVRRREYARQKFVLEKAKREEADVDYQKKVEQNAIAAEERTAKKRAKRLKKKQKQKGKKPKTEVKGMLAINCKGMLAKLLTVKKKDVRGSNSGGRGGKARRKDVKNEENETVSDNVTNNEHKNSTDSL
ncbi:PRKR-interacting protein 1 homolog [Argopecten irradians]|uniref:PRKR-interacting protein 1 homolog n=1 Tax=Argopecten irradians TaxID=31199 RepID=UPI0037138A70